MNFENFIKVYNDYFVSLLFLFICVFIIICIKIYINYRVYDNETWIFFKWVIWKKISEMIVFAIMIGCLVIMLEKVFLIDVEALLHISQYGKIIFSIWLIVNIISGKKLYAWQAFNDTLQKIKNEEYMNSSPENIMLDWLSRYNAQYTLETEKLGVLKSLTPISLVSLCAGYILEGKNILVDWNWYTTVFLILLLLYIYNLWKCYKSMQFLKIQQLEIERELRDMQFQREKQL